MKNGEINKRIDIELLKRKRLSKKEDLIRGDIKRISDKCDVSVRTVINWFNGVTVSNRSIERVVDEVILFNKKNMENKLKEIRNGE